ncbi:lysophospholipid acyltransferase family protein [Blastomonas sp. RAC04]|uniref:lysophospholipid acyltransferase family protein n=1 Tax=Blastomonas sp. RAC04 TaxID=1842535 RepID=UPI00083E2C3C|nr:lysophospholipid acyltransferase family protein [Blastomonas sp. RAC04]
MMNASEPVPSPSREPSTAHLGWAARALYALMMFIYRRHRFTAVGTPPPERRYIIIAVPHTSNWDFPNYMGVTRELGLETHFMAKTSLFRWPFHNFMRQMGGVPVDRSAAGDMVQQMIAEFAAREDFILTIAPEGTRKAVTAWRTGFYRIAYGAGVPIVCGFMDYGNRRAGLGPVIHPTGDYEKDMAPAFAFYAAMAGRNAVHSAPKG